MVSKNPTATRRKLLEAAFGEIYRTGFQGASLERILAQTGLTKGALYHHFRNKQELGYAVVDEVIRDWIRERRLAPLESAADPLLALADVVRDLTDPLRPESRRYGSPLNNLAQEMSPLDEGFRARLQELYAVWQRGVARALRRGQDERQVRWDVDPRSAAAYLVASYEGLAGLLKTSQDAEAFEAALRGLRMFLESLRPEAQERA